MTKTEFIEAVRSGIGETATLQTARRAVDTVFDTLADAVVKEGEFRLAGFGTWRLKQRAAREGRNPHTGEALRIPARTQVAFKAATALKQRVQPPEPKGKRKKG